MPSDPPKIPKPSDYSDDEEYEADQKEYQENLQYIKECKLEFEGDRAPAPASYGPKVFERKGFKMQDDSGNMMVFKVGGYVSDANSSRSSSKFKGDVGANYIARIVAVLESEHDGNCHVALQYFWRWGQIHQDADRDGADKGCPRLTAPKRSAELFLQAEHVCCMYHTDDNPNNIVRRADGSYREVRSAAYMDAPVTVLTYNEVLARYPGRTWREALDKYEKDYEDKVEGDSEARRDFFYWRYVYDHTDYSFKFDPYAFGGHIERRLLTEAERRMADIFCGAGHMSVGSRTAGWAVSYGVDSDQAAISSFMMNTFDYNGELPFNPSGHPPTQTMHCTVEEFARQAAFNGPSGPLGANVGWLHFSPPCQNLSKAKQEPLRVLTGETLMVVPRIVAALQPAFVTLEEVPGFIVQKFRKKNVQVYRAARKLRGRQAGPSQSQTAAASESQGPLGDENALGDDDDGEDSVGQDDVDDINEALQALQQQQDGGSSKVLKDVAVFRPFLLVVPQLLDEGYQVRMCMLECAQYGLPSRRVRIFLYAAKHGYQLPTPPPPRYEVPPYAQRYFCDSQEEKQTDATFMPKELLVEGPKGQTVDAGCWYDVLTAAAESKIEDELLPPITLLEALGDLPHIMAPHHAADTTHSPRSSGASSSRQQQPAAAAAGAAAGGAPWRRQQQQQGRCVGGGSSGSRLKKGVLQKRLNCLREEGQAAAEEAHAAQGGKNVPVTFGRQCDSYDPQKAVMPYILAGVPAAEAVADLTPVSAFAQFCRTPHYVDQPLRGFLPGVLSGHLLLYPRKVSLNLPSDPTDDAVMKPLGTVGTVVGKNYSGPTANSTKTNTAIVHFAEPRMLTHRERARCNGTPDWLHYKGKDTQVDQQVGNAVPYPVAVEVAGSVWEAATGQPMQGLPVLKGPSPAGMGLSAADRDRWVGWWEKLQVEEKHGVVLGWKEAMLEGGLLELKVKKVKPETSVPGSKKGRRGSRSEKPPAKRSRTSTPAAAAAEGSAGAAAADSAAAEASMEESASQQ